MNAKEDFEMLIIFDYIKCFVTGPFAVLTISSLPLDYRNSLMTHHNLYYNQKQIHEYKMKKFDMSHISLHLLLP